MPTKSCNSTYELQVAKITVKVSSICSCHGPVCQCRRHGWKNAPFPFDPLLNPAAAQFDQTTLRDRFNEIQTDLTDSEHIVLGSFLTVLSGAKLEEAGLFSMLHSWALCGYSAEVVMALCVLFKLRDNQLFFAYNG